MSLRGQPLERTATLPDGRSIGVRVGLAENGYVARSQIDTVAIELWDEARGEHLAGIATVLAPEQDSAARELLHEVVSGLESGELEPTAGALEPLADRVR